VSEIDAPEAWNLAPDLSLDGRTLWLSSDRAGGAGGLDLWVATRTERGQPWGNVQNLGSLNSPDWDTDVSVSADQLELVFSRRPSANADLLVSTRPSVLDPWPPPAAVSELDTAADEWDAALALDGRLLLYTSSHSERADLDGSLHIYEARRASLADPFGPGRLVEELAAPGAIDEDPWLSNDGRVLVFTSTRDGRRQLYQSRR
jgi:Tol biopolymer transport system component